jgi:DNA invertase Pin-like site-specific DNA recombinase
LGPPARSGEVKPTLNILLSFAQFEREVIGERIRDKVRRPAQEGDVDGRLSACTSRRSRGSILRDWMAFSRMRI